MQTMTGYRSKVTTAEEALRVLKSGDRVYIHSNAAAPAKLIEAMVARAPHIKNVEIVTLLTLGEAPYAEPEHAESFRVQALFIGKNVRDAVNAGRADYTPVFLGEIPRLFGSGALPIDVCLLQVSPPDEHGYCSYGVSVDCTIAARKAAKIVIAQVNRHMPRTMGRSFVHVSKLDYIVESDEPIAELAAKPISAEESEIGRHIADLIDDGATLQMGIGGIPNAVLANLTSKRNLGVHTEMFSDGLVDLVERGASTMMRKPFCPASAQLVS